MTSTKKILTKTTLKRKTLRTENRKTRTILTKMNLTKTSLMKKILRRKRKKKSPLKLRNLLRRRYRNGLKRQKAAEVFRLIQVLWLQGVMI